MKVPRKLALPVLSGLLLIAAQQALAQKTGPHGGLLSGKEDHQTELVVSATELAVYLLEHGKPNDTKGVTLKAAIRDAGKAANVDFVAADAKKMVGKLSNPLGKGAIVVLSGKDTHGHVISARYVLK